MTGTNQQPGNPAGPGRRIPEDGEVGAISPDYAHIQAAVARDGVWEGSELDGRLRHFAAISAQCVGGFDPCLQDHIRAGMEHGITAQQVKGIFIQLLFYAGIPATVHGLLQSQQVINEREEWKAADVPLEHDWLDTLQEKLERAGRLRTSLWGEDADREIEESFAQRLTPEASDIVDGYNFGEVWTRSDLEPRERVVCVLSALMSRGHWKELRRYIRYALNMGFSQREICEVLAQAGWYRGWAHVEDALEEARAVFDGAQS